MKFKIEVSQLIPEDGKAYAKEVKIYEQTVTELNLAEVCVNIVKAVNGLIDLPKEE